MVFSYRTTLSAWLFGAAIVANTVSGVDGASPAGAYLIDLDEGRVHRSERTQLRIYELAFHPRKAGEVFVGFGTFAALRYDVRASAFTAVYPHRGLFPKLLVDERGDQLVSAGRHTVCWWKISDGTKTHQVEIPIVEWETICALARCRKTGHVAVGTTKGHTHVIHPDRPEVQTIWRETVERQLAAEKRVLERISDEVDGLLDGEPNSSPSSAEPKTRGEPRRQESQNETETGRQRRLLTGKPGDLCTTPRGVTSLSFTGKPGEVLIGYQGIVVLWNTSAKLPVASFSGYGWGAFVDAENTPAVALRRGNRLDFVNFIDPESAPAWSIELSDGSRIAATYLAPSGRYVALTATRGRSGGLSMWDLTDHSRLWSKNRAPPPDAVSFSGDERVLACALGSRVSLYATKTGLEMEQAELPVIFLKRRTPDSFEREVESEGFPLGDAATGN